MASPDTKELKNEIKSEMLPYESVLQEKFGTDLSGVEYSFPWNRFFEVEIE